LPTTFGQAGHNDSPSPQATKPTIQNVTIVSSIRDVTISTHWLLSGALYKKVERSPLGGASNLFAALFVQAPAFAFRFLRQPSRPNAPRPVAKSGSAAGIGVAVGNVPNIPISIAEWTILGVWGF